MNRPSSSRDPYADILADLSSRGSSELFTNCGTVNESTFLRLATRHARAGDRALLAIDHPRLLAHLNDEAAEALCGFLALPNSSILALLNDCPDGFEAARRLRWAIQKRAGVGASARFFARTAPPPPKRSPIFTVIGGVAFRYEKNPGSGDGVASFSSPAHAARLVARFDALWRVAIPEPALPAELARAKGALLGRSLALSGQALIGGLRARAER